MIVDLTLDPALARWGPVALTSSGLGAALALLAVAWWGLRQPTDTGGGGVARWTVLGWGLLAGIAGARLAQVATQAAYYRANPGEIVQVWDGAGDATIMTVCAGLGMCWAARRHVVLGPRALARLASAIFVGIACASGGAFLAGSSWGRPTRGDWGVIYWHSGAILPPDLIGVPLHPVPLYRSAGTLFLLAVVWLLGQFRASAAWGWRVGIGGLAFLIGGLSSFSPAEVRPLHVGTAILLVLVAFAWPRALGVLHRVAPRARHAAHHAIARRWVAPLTVTLLAGLALQAAPVPESPGRWEPKAERAAELESAWIVGYAFASPRVGDRISTGLYLALAEGEGPWAADYLERQAQALARLDLAVVPPETMALLQHYRALVGTGGRGDAANLMRRLIDDGVGPALRRQAEAELVRLRAQRGESSAERIVLP